ncbi:MAG: FtsW/RodA/SpoVE family cell cycle protein [Selenomonadales bacterium]|nr:FtsW/RodA/SpoVE family cell cycle protein [Selenomonadales bacterium]MBQ2246007.1 FtsW/RodA/SpoVE family cell cycle protein [Selenomonadales bacterium]
MRSILNLFHDNGQGVLLSVLVLTIFGAINIYSASYVASGGGLAIKQVILGLVGFGAMYITSKINYWKTEEWGKVLTIVAIGLCIVVRFTGEEINGARRWLDLGFFQFQPSEIAKLASVMLAASYIGKTLRSGGSIELISKTMGAILAMGGIILLQPDMGTAAIVIAIGVALFFMGGLNSKQIRTLVGVVAASVVVCIMFAPYRLMRVLVWLGIEENRDIEYQASQAKMVIGSGGFGGAGWGGGLSKYSYLPESHTDFAFAVFCEEWGFILTILCIVFPFVLFTHHGFRIAKQTEDCYGKMLALGLTLLISGQAVSNMLMVMGSLPVIGVPLPFISYGGTSLIINLVCVGGLLSIHRKNVSLARSKLKREQAEADRQAAAESKE